jgi:hypothetical protein
MRMRWRTGQHGTGQQADSAESVDEFLCKLRTNFSVTHSLFPCTYHVLLSPYHGLDGWDYAHGDGEDDALELAHLLEDAKEAESAQDAHLLDPARAVRGKAQEGHGGEHHPRIEERPRVCPRKGQCLSISLSNSNKVAKTWNY